MDAAARSGWTTLSRSRSRAAIARHGRQGHADIRDAVRLRREALAQELRIGEFPGIESPVDLVRQPGFAAVVVGQGEQVHHPAAGLTVVQTLAQRVKGAAVGVRGGTGRRGGPS